MLGHTQTVAGISSDSSGIGVSKTAGANGAIGPSTLPSITLGSYYFNGWLADNSTGEANSTLALVKGGIGNPHARRPELRLLHRGLYGQCGTLEL